MTASRHTRMLEDDNEQDRSSFLVGVTHLATGPIMLKISNRLASVMEGSSSPT